MKRTYTFLATQLRKIPAVADVKQHADRVEFLVGRTRCYIRLRHDVTTGDTSFEFSTDSNYKVQITTARDLMTRVSELVFAVTTIRGAFK